MYKVEYICVNVYYYTNRCTVFYYFLLISLIVLIINYKEEKSFKDASLSSDLLHNVQRSLIQDRSHVNVSSGSIKDQEIIDWLGY